MTAASDRGRQIESGTWSEVGTGETGIGTETSSGTIAMRTGMTAGAMHMVRSGMAEAGAAEAGPEIGRQAGVGSGIPKGAPAVLASLKFERR